MGLLSRKRDPFAEALTVRPSRWKAAQAGSWCDGFRAASKEVLMKAGWSAPAAEATSHVMHPWDDRPAPSSDLEMAVAGLKMEGLAKIAEASTNDERVAAALETLAAYERAATDVAAGERGTDSFYARRFLVARDSAPSADFGDLFEG